VTSTTWSSGGALRAERVHPITVLWTVPRTVSTSFERMMIERGDHVVVDEPFSRSYYLGPDKRSDRFAEVLPESSTGELVASLRAAAEEAPVFVKDMAYHATDLIGTETFASFRHCFLIRDPALTLRSLAVRWPDFTDDEAGWDALGAAADAVALTGEPLVVIDADELCADPSGVVRAWCQAMDLPFVEAALTWSPGMRPEWELWADWHESSARATGFRPPSGTSQRPPGADEPRLRELYERARPVYARLRRVRLTAGR
jgi:hypothetical protein